MQTIHWSYVPIFVDLQNPSQIIIHTKIKFFVKWQRIYFKQVENDKMFATSLILCIQLYKNTRYSTHTKKVRPLPVWAVLLVSQNKIIRIISFFLVWGKLQVECYWFVHKKPTRNLHLSLLPGLFIKDLFCDNKEPGEWKKMYSDRLPCTLWSCQEEYCYRSHVSHNYVSIKNA